MSNFRKLVIILIVAAGALISQFVYGSTSIAFYLIASVGGIMTFLMFVSMIKTLRSGNYGVDILAITAIASTLVVGEYWASLVVLIMLTGGDSLEDYATKQANKELTVLLNNSPQIAHRVDEDTVRDIPVNEIKVGDHVLVKSGEIIPVDGRLLSGSISIDESSLTGESVPVEKKTTDLLMSGSLNRDSSFTFEVTKKAEDSQYQLLVRIVQESNNQPARFVRLADRYAVPFTIIAYIIGLIAWFVSKDPVRFAEVMVVASPCPLILAAPIALVAGMNKASKNGIIVKNGTVIEKLSKAKTIAFDKTGTLTQGILTIEEIQLLRDTIGRDEFIQLVASAEQNSSHILAQSIMAYSKENNIELLPCDSFKEVTGQGIIATIQNKKVYVGKASFAFNSAKVNDNLTTVYVAINEKYIGRISFSDEVRRETEETIAHLKSLGVENILMLTGDNSVIANKIATEVGIDHVYSNCLPKDKINVLKNIPTELRPEIMVGDGVNDAPALSVADVGIAMGARGSTAASESADVVILKDDLTRVTTSLEIAKQTMSIARQSVLIGIVICTILMIVASTGVLPALIGAALQEVVDVASILSALRARK